MCLRKWRSSGLDSDSVKPNSVLSAIPLMTELGPLRPTDAPRLLGSCARLSQKEVWAKRGKPGSHFTPRDETLGSSYSYDRATSASPLRQQKATQSRCL